MNKKLPLYLLFLLFITSNITLAINEKNITITGKVIDADTNTPLEYATISFYSIKEKKIVDGVITNIDGEFSIKIKDDIYNISVEYIGYKPYKISNKKIVSDINLGTIKLNLDLEALGEVEIIAERTSVEVKLDKKIYNVGKDLTVRGGTVSDVLDNVPSVSVDGEGNVALRGNDNVRILINGKPSGLVGVNSTDALRQLPADAIERVEVITSPSARYESEGTAGILNIILRRSKLQGLNGAITANVGHPDAAGISGNINFRTGNVNIFNTLAYRYNESIGNWYTYTTYKSTGNILDEKRDTQNIRKGITNNFGIEWYITDSASITTSLVYNDGNNNENSINNLLQYDADLNLIGQSLRLDPMLNDAKTMQYAFNFTKDFQTSGHKLTFDFQYEDNNNDNFSLINVNGLNTDILTELVDESIILLRSDYVLPLGDNGQFEMGYRGDFNTQITDYQVELLNRNSGAFEIDRNLSNVFNFKNYINAFYVQYGSKINKFSYLLGLRMENTQTTLDQPTSGDFEIKKYTGFFPTVNFSYAFSEKENITLGYNRRLSRPWSFFLNPFPSRSSLTNIFQGNPALLPTYAGKIDLGYLNRFGKFTLSTSIYFQHATDVINFVSNDTGNTVEIDGQDVPVIERGPANIATEDRYGFEFNVIYNPTKNWRINTDFNLFNIKVNGFYLNDDFYSNNTSWTLRLNNKYTLPGNVDWQTNLNYRGPSMDAQNKRDAMFSADVAFSKDIFKDKASIAFNVTDLFNSRVMTGIVETEEFITDREIRFRGVRTFNLSFTYRFNQQKKREIDRGNYGNGGDIQM
ncbi:outer membrane beta-barrel protein [Siansivirga zeaxanthinifaciens]|uniref:TonB-dependent receptor n=1 Tax=Siansivirga zeaxanthinifaciens CC-SAMT-1 TaxID=1454006 RepID=A0A0C5WB33_9FLAO|nr:outer membrane beta-barrel protein [Siansivirga zeaxanthinifaciens]AJR04313.1 TonB-dependent receptor [Siansivirga zeaxanthinifaciens CC-SAMT-1]